jgi:hypothetical protein
MKYSVENLTNRQDQAKEIISGFKGKVDELSHSVSNEKKDKTL